MADFNMKFDTGNDAFGDDPTPETIRVIEVVLDRLRSGYVDGKCVDFNGNTVGEWFSS